MLTQNQTVSGPKNIEPELVRIPAGTVTMGVPAFPPDSKLPHRWRETRCTCLHSRLLSQRSQSETILHSVSKRAMPSQRNCEVIGDSKIRVPPPHMSVGSMPCGIPNGWLARLQSRIGSFVTRNTSGRRAGGLRANSFRGVMSRPKDTATGTTRKVHHYLWPRFRRTATECMIRRAQFGRGARSVMSRSHRTSQRCATRILKFVTLD